MKALLLFLVLITGLQAQPSLQALRTDTSQLNKVHRFRCVVQYQRFNGHITAHDNGQTVFVWPRGANSARVLAATPEVARVQPGDEIEVEGSLMFQGDLLQFTDAVYHVLRHDLPTPQPVEVDASQLASTAHHGQLMRLTAPLIYIARNRNQNYWAMKLYLGKGSSIVASIDFLAEPNREHLPDGYLVELTGFLTKQDDGRTHVWCRTLEDIRVLGPSENVLHQRRWGWGAALGLLVIAIALWIVLLRRQVRHQTAELRTANDRLRTSEAELLTNLAREKEVSDLKSNFVSMVSHEFRTPLAVILSSTELLRNHLAKLSEDARRTQMDNIIQSTLNMSGMIEEVLLLGKVEGGRMACTPVEVDLAGLAAVLVDEGLSATKQRCPIQLTIDDDVRNLAHADPALLRHIFSNLLSNAVKYSAEGSTVNFGIVRQGKTAICTVRDRGIGIPEQDRAHLFEAFHRAGNVGQRSGTGLGLVIVKRCVELHGGSIMIDSIEHGGTTVTVTLPVFESGLNHRHSLGR